MARSSESHGTYDQTAEEHNDLSEASIRKLISDNGDMLDEWFKHRFGVSTERENLKSAIATLRAENEALRAQLATARADALEEAFRHINDLDVGPDHDGVIVEVLDVVISLKEKQP